MISRTMLTAGAMWAAALTAPAAAQDAAPPNAVPTNMVQADLGRTDVVPTQAIAPEAAEPQPVLSDRAVWVGAVIGGHVLLFLAAAVIGPIYRANVTHDDDAPRQH